MKNPKSIMNPWDLGELTTEDLLSVIEYRSNNIQAIKERFGTHYPWNVEIHYNEIVIKAAKKRLGLSE